MNRIRLFIVVRGHIQGCAQLARDFQLVVALLCVKLRVGPVKPVQITKELAQTLNSASYDLGFQCQQCRRIIHFGRPFI